MTPDPAVHAASPNPERGRGWELFDLVFGDAPGNCELPPAEPVRFGQKHWLAQHRWLEPVVGMAGLVLAAGVYVLAASVLNRPAGLVLGVVWLLFAAGAVFLRVRRPCTVLRLPIHALIVGVVILGLAGPLGYAAN